MGREGGWESKIRVLPSSPMHANRWARYAGAALVSIAWLGTFDGPARAADGSEGPWDVDGRWIPSASFFSMGHADKRTAVMSADTRLKPEDPLLDRDGQSLGLPWSFGGTLDLASPVVLDVPGRPRLFAHADVGYTYDVEDPVVTRYDPGGQPNLPANQTSVLTIANVGASVRVEGKPLVFSGGFGTVFAFDAFDRGFRLRPTLEWMYRRDTMKNQLGAGETESTTPGETECAPACRTLFAESQTEKGFHSLGPGIELEADAGRAGEFLVGFYGSFRAYYLVGDRKANLRTTRSWERTDGQPTTRADTAFITQYEREPWHYRFGFGVRVLWSPED